MPSKVVEKPKPVEVSDETLLQRLKDGVGSAAEELVLR